MSVNHQDKLKKSILGNLKAIKRIIKNNDEATELSESVMTNAVEYGNELQTQLYSLLEFVRNRGQACDVSVPGETEHKLVAAPTISLGLPDLTGVLTVLKGMYLDKVKEIKTSVFDFAAFATASEVSKVHGDNALFELVEDKLLLLTLTPHPSTGDSCPIAKAKILFYTNEAHWSNLENTIIDVTLSSNGLVKSFHAGNIPSELVESLVYILTFGFAHIDPLPIVAEAIPDETTNNTENLLLDQIEHLEDSDVVALTVNIIQKAAGNSIPHVYEYDKFNGKSFQFMRDVIQAAYCLIHPDTGEEYLFYSLSVPTDNAKYGYEILHALIPKDRSKSNESLFELVSNTDMSLVRFGGEKGFTHKQHAALKHIVEKGSCPHYVKTSLRLATDFNKLVENVFGRLTREEDLSEYVVRLPSGTMSIDPRVTEKMGDITTPSRSVMKGLMRYLANFIPVIDSKPFGVPHGLHRHCALRNLEQTTGIPSKPFYIRVDSHYADMVLTMAVPEKYVSYSPVEGDDRDYTNLLTVTWHGMVNEKGKINFPIDLAMQYKLFFSFHTKDIPNGTPVPLSKATNYELEVFLETFAAQFAKWDALGTKPKVDPITVSDTEVWESSMPKGERFPEQDAIEAIVNGTLTIADIKKA